MATALRPIGHEDRLSVVDHLDELRTRLIICAVTLAAAFGLCFWQNQPLIHLLNRPYEQTTPTTAAGSGGGRLAQTAATEARLRSGLTRAAAAFDGLGRSRTLAPSDKRLVAQAARALGQAANALPRTIPKREPVTLGVGEPFTATITVAAYFALVFSLPVILYQLYAFILPAFSRRERQVALPLMLMVPFLFVIGVAFAYFLVLPPAIGFLQNFNNQSFDVLVQARDYYKFAILVLLSLGLIFQVPVGMLALSRVGIIDSRRLRRWWRYATVVTVIVAALLPGVDPVTTILEWVPLMLLYALSIGLVALAERRSGRRHEGDEVLPALDDEEE